MVVRLKFETPRQSAIENYILHSDLAKLSRRRRGSNGTEDQGLPCLWSRGPVVRGASEPHDGASREEEALPLRDLRVRGNPRVHGRKTQENQARGRERGHEIPGEQLKNVIRWNQSVCFKCEPCISSVQLVTTNARHRCI